MLSSPSGASLDEGQGTTAFPDGPVVPVERSRTGCLPLAASELFAQHNPDFIGNVEGRDIAKGTADVVVCDGYVGNVVLKFA